MVPNPPPARAHVAGSAASEALLPDAGAGPQWPLRVPPEVAVQVAEQKPQVKVIQLDV